MIRHLTNSLNYIEANLEQPLTIEDIAKIAYSSKFHYQRMFYMLTGATVSEYIRKRRLTLAAQELATSDGKVIDIALKYGYETPESFAKAFRKLHGISPTAARGQGQVLRAFPRLSFQIQVKGAEEMQYTIQEKEAFSVVGKTMEVNMNKLEIIGQTWAEVNESGLLDRLAKEHSARQAVGACFDYEGDLKTFTYCIAVEKRGDHVPDGCVTREVPAATWAVFKAIGPVPGAIQKTMASIYAEWFPSTGYEHAAGPDLEVYPLDENIQSDDHCCELWIPIKKK